MPWWAWTAEDRTWTGTATGQRLDSAPHRPGRDAVTGRSYPQGLTGLLSVPIITVSKTSRFLSKVTHPAENRPSQTEPDKAINRCLRDTSVRNGVTGTRRLSESFLIIACESKMISEYKIN